ncbi:MAG: guanylate kinase [Planctomycetota bacterium]
MVLAGAGKLVIFSGPSGAGKTTVLRRVFQRANVPLVASVSATTRPPRPGEAHGADYYFLSPDEFAARRARGEFLETVEVFGRGYWYGTLLSEVEERLAEGKWVLLEIDVQGAMDVAKKYPDAITVFLRPSSLEELERRLRGRGTETEDAIGARLAQARHELALAGCYRHQVVNDDLDRAVDEICSIFSRYAETDGR